MSSALSRIVLALVAGVASMQLTAGAQDPSVTDQLRLCAAEPDSSHRLDCYDRVTARLPPPVPESARPGSGAAPASAVTAAAPTTMAPSTAPIASTSPPAAEFGVSNGPLEAKRLVGKPQTMTAVVAQVTARPHGELVMTLDNGQVWQQNEAVAYFPLKAGDKVEISVGALGSYVLWAPFRRATKVTRVN